MEIRHLRFIAALLVVHICRTGYSQSIDVTAQIEVTHADKQRATHVQSSGVVIWLNSLSSDPPALVHREHFRLVQKDKKFVPHLLVVPLGSSVDFPNLDPFFHNVFSQYNGKRFDLGLYEEGSNKSVRFDHEGVSYIFCNIHPEMSAVVIALATPYVGISSPQGELAIHNVPAGNYEMTVWAEGVDTKQLNALTRHVHVGMSQVDLGVIKLTENGVPPHKNKYGQDYFPSHDNTY